MSYLVRESCVLRFEHHEFGEFFGIVSPLDEEGCSYSYELERDGVRLLFTVFPIDGSVYTSVYRDGITASETAIFIISIRELNGFTLASVDTLDEIPTLPRVELSLFCRSPSRRASEEEGDGRHQCEANS